MRITIAVSIAFIFCCRYGHCQVSVSSDKAAYLPGEEVVFTLGGNIFTNIHVRYTHLGEQLKDEPLTSSTWRWSPPEADFSGYLVELYVAGRNEKPVASIGVDVSSDWSRFIRYGFLSKYPKMTLTQTSRIVAKLNRYHINGLQFYDWQYKHQQPLGGTVENPLKEWKDIGNRDTYLSTVKQFIAAAHKHRIKTMAYNLIYGVLDDAGKNGVKDEWYLYQDKAHHTKEVFVLPAPFTSPIYLMNPADPGWQNYINLQNKKLYAALDFDGYHIDQLGNRDKPLYSYNGDPVNLPETFKPFIESVKLAEPDRSIAMNSVNQYGQPGVARSPANFLYTELWPPIINYADMVNVITENDSLSQHSKQTVLTAYMNYRLADHKGYFNTPAILLTDAVIFAFGGSHLELGDHMLDKEYFPQDSLQMKPDLAAPLTKYYDFLVAYENILRGGGSFLHTEVTTPLRNIHFAGWPAKEAYVIVVGKQVDSSQVIHLLNFTDATTLDWQDNKGIQKEPKVILSVPVVIRHEGRTKKVWMASPDLNYGAPIPLKFSQHGDQLSFTIPSIKYWDMIVVE